MKKRTSLRRNSMRCDRICGKMWAETLTPFELVKLQFLIIMVVFVGHKHSHIHVGSGSVGPMMWKFGRSGNSIIKSRIACLHDNFGVCQWWWLGNTIHRHIIARNIGVFWFQIVILIPFTIQFSSVFFCCHNNHFPKFYLTRQSDTFQQIINNQTHEKCRFKRHISLILKTWLLTSLCHFRHDPITYTPNIRLQQQLQSFLKRDLCSNEKKEIINKYLYFESELYSLEILLMIHFLCVITLWQFWLLKRILWG